MKILLLPKCQQLIQSIRGVESEGVSLESLIDLAYTSATLAGSVACYVSENYIETDHQAVSMEIKRN